MAVLKIASRYDEAVLFECEADSIKEAVQKAVADGANLTRANLTRANLTRANLTRANLYGANLTQLSGETVMPFGETWRQYLEEVVPSLLTATGKSVAEIVGTGCWNCHNWSNCPMHAVFGIGRVSDGPILLRPRIEEFVRLFDAGLIPVPSAVSSNDALGVDL